MARPVIAKAQVELALKLGADAVAHGATGKGKFHGLSNTPPSVEICHAFSSRL